MFTGLVEEIGRVLALDAGAAHGVLRVEAKTVTLDTDVGDSINVDGCCLTVTEVDAGTLTFDLMAETLRVTALGMLRAGGRVNLERAMHQDRRFGGHLVQGHVDGVGEVVDRTESPGTVTLTIEADRLARWLVPKGSVTAGGVSLTVVDADLHGRFTVGLIPTTCESTTLGDVVVGDRLNLEADVVAKYVERLLAAGVATPYRGVFDADPREEEQ